MPPVKTAVPPQAAPIYEAYRGWLAALQGDAVAAQTVLAGLDDMRASEELQEQSLINLVEAVTAAACRQPQAALRHAQAIGIH